MNKNMLVVYYTWSKGNTEKIAERLADACGADIARIETVEPYPEDYDATVKQAQDEIHAGFDPEIEPLEFDPAAYDIIAVGAPTWWYTMAPAVATLVHSIDWAGKTVVPFSTSAGWPGSTNDDIVAAAAGATSGPGLEAAFDSTGGARMKTPQADVDAWIAAVKKLLN